MTQTHWRLALMFDAPEGDLAKLESGLRQARDEISAAAQGNPVRMGVALPSTPENDDQAAYAATWRSVDGAIEITLPNAAQAAIPAICEALRPILARIAAPTALEVMAGAMHYMVPVRRGGVFLSLAFLRYPGTTVDQFRDWWLNQHAGIAIPIMGEGLLAYDQVHVEENVSRAAAEALGVPFVAYDAYDNLTWNDTDAYAASSSDAEAMVTIVEDEMGRIDNDSRRYALMRELT